MNRLRRLSAVVGYGVLALGAANIAVWAQGRPIDTQHSKITVHVFKSGVFSSFGDNHEVEAPITEGSIDTTKREVSLTVRTAQLKVLDPGLAPEKRAQVQTRMLSSDVLDVERFKEIQFHSTKVEEVDGHAFRVQGSLTLHGQTAPVSLEVTEDGEGYKGHCAFRQTTFGIKPITIAGGTVKVKDEIKIDFTIVTASPSAAAQ